MGGGGTGAAKSIEPEPIGGGIMILFPESVMLRRIWPMIGLGVISTGNEAVGKVVVLCGVVWNTKLYEIYSYLTRRLATIWIVPSHNLLSHELHSLPESSRGPARQTQ